MIKAVLFDLDGTLADTQKDLADSMNRILAAHGLPLHSDEEYKYLVGKGLKNLVIASLPKVHRNDGMIDTCLQEMITDYRQNCLNKTALYPGIAEMLGKLNTMQLPVVVFTNKDHDLAIIVCNVLLKDFKIETILGRSNERKRKPDPEGALYLSKAISTKPENILYIGDTDVDMQCAKRAGMIPLGVLWGFRKKEELLTNGAVHLAEKPMDIIQTILDTNNN